MALTMELEGLTVRVNVPFEGGQYEVTVGNGYDSTPDEFKGKVFRSLEATVKAIRAYNLTLRKSFTNPVAYVMRHRNETEQVRVTSVTENGRECWITGEQGREKVAITRLFADAVSVGKAIATEAAHRQAIQDAWAAVPVWRPEFTDQKEGGE
jgi:hypothetical protein